MSADVEVFEAPIEEDRLIPIENSHLSEGRCECGAVALVAPGRRPRCGLCIRALADRVTEPPPRPLIALAPLGQGHPPHPAEERAPYPVPEITSRDEWDGDGAPSAFRTNAEKVRKAGWQVRVQRSRGCPPNSATGAPTAVRDLFALIVTNGTASAYAVHSSDPCPAGCPEFSVVRKTGEQKPHAGGAGKYHSSEWSSVMLWSDRQTWFPLASITDLLEYVTAGGDMPESWFDAIRGRAAASEETKRERLDCNRGIHAMRFRSMIEGDLMSCSRCGNSWPARAEPWRKPKTKKSEAN